MDKSTSHPDFCQFDVPLLMQISHGEAALSLATNGFHVFPLHYPKNQICSCSKVSCKTPGKHPLTTHGYKDATRNINQIKDWWKYHPLANIGIATGTKSQIVVLDIDAKSNGFTSLKGLEEKIGKITSGVEVKSGGGGLHFYFSHPGGEIKTKISALPGIDIIAENASIVAPPSRHISGNNYGSSPFRVENP